MGLSTPKYTHAWVPVHVGGRVGGGTRWNVRPASLGAWLRDAKVRVNSKEWFQSGQWWEGIHRRHTNLGRGCESRKRCREVPIRSISGKESAAQGVGSTTGNRVRGWCGRSVTSSKSLGKRQGWFSTSKLYEQRGHEIWLLPTSEAEEGRLSHEMSLLCLSEKQCFDFHCRHGTA